MKIRFSKGRLDDSKYQQRQLKKSFESASKRMGIVSWFLSGFGVAINNNYSETFFLFFAFFMLLSAFLISRRSVFKMFVKHFWLFVGIPVLFFLAGFETLTFVAILHFVNPDLVFNLNKIVWTVFRISGLVAAVLAALGAQIIRNQNDAALPQITVSK